MGKDYSKLCRNRSQHAVCTRPLMIPRIRSASAPPRLASQIEPQTKPSLLGLTAELRNQIYEYAMLRPPIRVYATVFDDFRPFHYEQAPLIRVNRQLRKETLPLFYGVTCFDLVHLSPTNSRAEATAAAAAVSIWQAFLGEEYLKLIRHVIIAVPPPPLLLSNRNTPPRFHPETLWASAKLIKVKSAKHTPPREELDFSIHHGNTYSHFEPWRTGVECCHCNMKGSIRWNTTKETDALAMLQIMKEFCVEYQGAVARENGLGRVCARRLIKPWRCNPMP